MDKKALVIRYIDLASQYSFMMCGNEPVNETKKEQIKTEIYEIREQLGMDKISII
ncbi:MAG TPA: hypothetical protein GXX75_04660 [Clostridiales bacterium]|nr:hypothetical protein [Clostridiales bacterium]